MSVHQPESVVSIEFCQNRLTVKITCYKNNNINTHFLYIAEFVYLLILNSHKYTDTSHVEELAIEHRVTFTWRFTIEHTEICMLCWYVCMFVCCSHERIHVDKHTYPCTTHAQLSSCCLGWMEYAWQNLKLYSICSSTLLNGGDSTNLKHTQGNNLSLVWFGLYFITNPIQLALFYSLHPPPNYRPITSTT